MITKILSSNQTNTGLIGIDGRNADSKRELYISDIPTDRNTIVFRLQNVHTHTITLDKTNGIDILFPKGLFDDVSKLNITNCEVSKWKVNANEDLINSSTLETDVKKTVEQFQRLKFIKIEEEIDKTPINQKEGLDNEIKELLKGYITDSLKIKQAVKELFEGYLENKPSQAFGDFSIVGQLYNNLNKLNEQIEGNISKLILLKSNFQQQRNLINTFVDKTVKNAITSELKKLSEKNIFEDPQNSNGAILALTKLVDIINKLKLHPNLVNL